MVYGNPYPACKLVPLAIMITNVIIFFSFSMVRVTSGLIRSGRKLPCTFSSSAADLKRGGCRTLTGRAVMVFTSANGAVPSDDPYLDKECHGQD